MLTLPSSLVRSSATSPVRVSVKLTAGVDAEVAGEEVAADGFIWLAGCCFWRVGLVGWWAVQRKTEFG